MPADGAGRCARRHEPRAGGTSGGGWTAGRCGIGSSGSTPPGSPGLYDRAKSGRPSRLDEGQPATLKAPGVARAGPRARRREYLAGQGPLTESHLACRAAFRAPRHTASACTAGAAARPQSVSTIAIELAHPGSTPPAPVPTTKRPAALTPCEKSGSRGLQSSGQAAFCRPQGVLRQDENSGTSEQPDAEIRKTPQRNQSRYF